MLERALTYATEVMLMLVIMMVFWGRYSTEGKRAEGEKIENDGNKAKIHCGWRRLPTRR